ncbi:unnamed protein product [Strongylus vulgaris]|uniref:Uncharacterized protein n=1 Tax=Strongylus vulgaris TaxID=40348 RepID=A0A3P7JBJ2_STRVU|nr:unnamed protein product [Strongylus vulgaris]
MGCSTVGAAAGIQQPFKNLCMKISADKFYWRTKNKTILPGQLALARRQFVLEELVEPAAVESGSFGQLVDQLRLSVLVAVSKVGVGPLAMAGLLAEAASPAEAVSQAEVVPLAGAVLLAEEAPAEVAPLAVVLRQQEVLVEKLPAVG